MSDIPTDATGVHMRGQHAYLYDRNGTYVADHRIVDDITDAFTLDAVTNDADAQRRTVEWLHTIGYRITGGDWTEHHGYLRAVEYVGDDDADGDVCPMGEVVHSAECGCMTCNARRAADDYEPANVDLHAPTIGPA